MAAWHPLMPLAFKQPHPLSHCLRSTCRPIQSSVMMSRGHWQIARSRWAGGDDSRVTCRWQVLQSCVPAAALSPLNLAISAMTMVALLPLRPSLQLYTPVLAWAQRVMGIRLEPTDSIFGATLGEKTLEAVEKHLQVGWVTASWTEGALLGSAEPC